MTTLHCDMERDCTKPVTHIGEDGWIYCATHAPMRRGYERCRKLTAGEKVTLEEGRVISYRKATR